MDYKEINVWFSFKSGHCCFQEISIANLSKYYYVIILAMEKSKLKTMIPWRLSTSRCLCTFRELTVQNKTQGYIYNGVQICEHSIIKNSYK